MKNVISKITAFAIILFCSQMAFGQKVTCFNGERKWKDIWVSAPYFNGGLIAEIKYPYTYAEANIGWSGNGRSKWCPGNCGYAETGIQRAGGIVVSIECKTEGSGTYAFAGIDLVW